MPKTTPFYLLNSLKNLTVTAFIIALAGCADLPQKPIKPTADTTTTKTEKKVEAPKERAKKTYTIDELKLLQAKAANESNWADYTIYATKIWRKSKKNPASQAQIEEQVWSILSSLSADKLAPIHSHTNPDVQAWTKLLETFNGPSNALQTGLTNLSSFESDAIYYRHLLAKLIANLPKEADIQQISVLLPLEGKYKVVSQQIRSGIMKAFFASNQHVTLKFYDSSVLEDLESIYTQAKQDGADRIIGPLRKEAIQELASFHDKNLLALNSIENSPFTEFNFKSANAGLQMLANFESAGYKRLGLLTNDSPKTVAKAKIFQKIWTQENHSSELSIYPNTRPKLRAALGDLIHEKQSKERKNNLRWLLGRDLSFFPRTRQDLDAIVIYDNAHRMAVFRPQFDFFELDTPVYADSQLTPKNFQKIKVNPDLNRVSFLTYPAVLSPVDLESKLEAFGWDSFIISTHMKELQNGSCLTNGKTGILSLENNQVKQHLIWAKYDKKGNLKHAPSITKIAPVTSPSNLVIPE